MDNKPTHRQIVELYKCMVYHVPQPQLSESLQWLEDNGDRRDVSREIVRQRELRKQHKLTAKRCYESYAWKDYPGKENVQELWELGLARYKENYETTK